MSAIPRFHFYKTSSGVAGYLNREGDSVSAGLSFYDVITGKNIIIAGGQNGEVWRWADGAWSEVQVFAETTIMGGIFVTSAGTIFMSPIDNGILYRSVDGGLTFTSTALTNSDSLIKTFAEDSNGWIFGGEYPADAVGAVLWRSKDEGATWVDITSNLDTAPSRHIHGCYYDKYRDLLFVTIGDAGAGSKVQVSSDGGNTFISWDEVGQTTAMAFDSDYIYLAYDLAADTQLYRLETANNPAAAAETPSLMFSLTDTPAADGFVWQFHWSNGVLVAPYLTGSGGSRVYASDDQGDSWHLVYSGPVAGSQEALGVQAEIAEPSRFNGMRFGLDEGNNKGFGWQVIPWGQEIKVDPVSGSDSGDGISLPLKTLSNKIPVLRNNPIRLIADSASNEYITDINYLIADGLYGFTASAQVADSTASTGFESGHTVLSESTASGVTIDQADTTDPRTGTQHATMDAGTATGTFWAWGYFDNAGTSMSPGDEIWLLGWFKLVQAAWPANTALVSLGGAGGAGGAALDIWVNSTDDSIYARYEDSINGVYTYRQSTGTLVTAPVQEYAKLKLRVRAHDTEGRITVWLNDACAIDVIGVRTFVNGSKLLNDARFGFTSTAKPLTIYWDDLQVMVNKDPELDSAIKLAGTNQHFHGLKQSTGIVEVAGTDNAAIACLADTPSVTPILLTGTNASCLHGTFYKGAKAVENTSATGIIKNCIFDGQTTQAIDDSGSVTTAGNEYGAADTFGVTPDSTDTQRANDLANPAGGDFSLATGSAHQGKRILRVKDATGKDYSYSGKPETGCFARPAQTWNY